MKLFTGLLLPVAVSAAAINNEARQVSGLGGLLGGGAAPGRAGGFGGLLTGGIGSLLQGTSLKAVETKDLKPRIRQNAQRQLIRWGPLDLLGYNATKPVGSFSLDPHGQSYISTLTEGIPKNSAILAGQLSIAFEDGTRTTVEKGVYVHHMLAVDLGKTESNWVSFCDTNETGAAAPPAAGGAAPVAGFLGIGQDSGDAPQYFTPPDGSHDSGYKLGANDTIMVQTDLVNFNSDTKKVFITLDLEYVPKDQVKDDARIRLMTVTGCLQRRVNLSKDGIANTTSGRFPLYEDGYIVNARGHMHDGGDAMILSLNDKPICTSKATYGGAGSAMSMGGQTWESISSMTSCDNAVQVKKGDYLTLTSVYDLKAHPLRQADGHDMEVMGMYGVSFSPSSPDAAPAAPPGSEEARPETAGTEMGSETGMEEMAGMAPSATS